VWLEPDQVRAVPAGWMDPSAQVDSRGALLRLDSYRAGEALVARLTPTCDVRGAAGTG